MEGNISAGNRLDSCSRFDRTPTCDGRTDGQTHDDSKFLGHIFFIKAEDTSTRGHTWKLAKKHFRCDSRLYFFSQRVINRWNNLSQEDVDAQSINCFENRLEKRRTRQMDFSKDL